MNDDRRRILDMLAQGKITADEADRLLDAISEPSSRERTHEREIYCAFCGQRESADARLIVGKDRVAICTRCIPGMQRGTH